MHENSGAALIKAIAAERKWSACKELTADLFIFFDGFASGAKEAAFFGYFGEDLGSWVSDHVHSPSF